MKKGLLSILASALLVVGCQNYDDQFTNLESQISALATTVAGLSQVQSDLASLSGTVNSLQSSLAGQIDTALADGLADIDAAITDLEAATADVASSEDVQAITDAVAENQDDLQELLDQSSVFAGDVVVNTPTTLDAFHTIGTGLAIINGNVDIDVNSDMDIAKVQELVNFIEVTIKDFAYTAGTGVDTEVTFNNLAGTRSLTLDQEGGYIAQNLSSATKIVLDDDSSVDIVDLRGLTTVTSLSDGTGAGTFTFSKGTELHLTALPRYPTTSLSLGVDEGGVIDITALRDVESDGDDQALDLTLEGPDTVSITALTGDKASSSITLINVITATVNGYDGTINIGADVQNFSSDNLVDFTVVANSDLVTVDVTGKLNPNITTDKQGPAVDLSGHGDLETVTIAGDVELIDLDGNGNLTTVTITADVDGSQGIVLNGNSDLATINLTGAKAEVLAITGNSDIEVLTVDFTVEDSDDTDALVDGSITITGNESMETLNISTDNVETLNVSNNVDLETVDFTGMTAIGATGKATVTIKDNKLVAEIATDEEDGATAADDVAAGAAGDLGSFSTNSGLDTASVYLTAVAADADSTATVVFDEVDSVVDSEGATDSEVVDQTDYVVLSLVAAVPEVITGANDTVLRKQGFIVTATVGADVNVLIDNVTVTHNGSGYGAVTISGNQNVDLTNLRSSLALTRATALDVTMDVKKGGNAVGKAIVFQSTVASNTNGENYTDAQATAIAAAGTVNSFLTSYDVFTMAYGGRSVQATITTASKTGVAARNDIAAELSDAWNDKYGSSGTSSQLSLWSDIADTTGTLAAATLKSSNAGSRGYLDVIDITWAKASAAQVSAATGGVVTKTTALVMDWIIGADGSADNFADSDDLIITLEETVAGSLAGTQATVTGVYALTNAQVNYGGSAQQTDTTDSIYPEEARDDVKDTEEANEGVVTTAAAAAVSINRVGWL